MINKTFISLLFIAAFLLILLACHNEPQSGTATTISQDSLLKRGAYLITIMGCEDCHSPKTMSPSGPVPDAAHRFGGHGAGSPLPPVDTVAAKGWVLMSMDQTVAIGPWGVSYAANISSDTTGVGVWTEHQFATAMRKGKLKGLEGSRTLLPPMPWPNYTHLSDEDLKAIYTYLKNTKPVKNVVPPAKMPG